MARGRQRKQTAFLENVSPSERDLLLEDNGWVIVKKQRVTILLPPLPVSDKSTASDEGRSPVEDEDLTEATTTNKHLPPTENTSSPSKKVDASPLHNPSETGKLIKTSSKVVMKQREEFRRRSCSLPAVGLLMKQRLRARNLERKLESAGGLSRWLMSLGLGQFVRLFERRSVNKFQLAGLTMQKLKDMGAIPVGPRRKLMHAIECCCEPCHI